MKLFVMQEMSEQVVQYVSKKEACKNPAEVLRNTLIGLNELLEKAARKRGKITGLRIWYSNILHKDTNPNGDVGSLVVHIRRSKKK